MFHRLSVLFLALSTWPGYSHDNDGSARKGLLESIANDLEKSSGNLRRKLKYHKHDHHNYNNVDGFFDSCHLVSQHFGDDFLSATTTTGGCSCDGSLDSILTLNCDFENVCDEETGMLCANVDVNVTLADIIDETGSFGDDPKMSLASCVDTNIEFLDKMCLEMEFAKPDFFLPSTCSFSYGDEKCTCKINHDSDSYLPCYDFDCSEVDAATTATPEVARMLVSDRCKTIDLSGKNGVSMFLPALASSESHGDEKIADDMFFHINEEKKDQLSPMEDKFAKWAEEKNGGE